jgi:leader peptidase (prepilin peptidase) / N-methyltransferase
VTNVELAALTLAPGLALGSFLNVLVTRVPLRRSIVRPGSACASCGHALSWPENVPLVSYAVLRGRCRHCGTRIPAHHPVVEAATALLVAAAAVKFGLSWDFAVATVFLAALVTVSATDIERRIIPNRIVVPATVVVLAAKTAVHPSIEWAAAGAGAAAFLLAAALAYPGGMGMGDVKLAALLGVALGRSVTVALLLGFLAALVPSFVLFARHGSAARKMAIALGPFLALGGAVALFAGHAVLHWYTRTM